MSKSAKQLIAEAAECETCDKAIPKERLKAVPHAGLCIECQRQEEQV